MAAVGVSVRYVGDLQCRAQHGPSKDEIATDAPKDNAGKGEHFSPTDLFATSLGACMLTTMAIAAKTRQIAVDGMSAEVEKHMGTSPRRHVARIVVKITMPKGLDERGRTVLEAAAKSCPVTESLSERTQIDLSFHYPA